MMENGINGVAKSTEESLSISLTSGSTKYRTQILKSLQQDLERDGSVHSENIQVCGLLINSQTSTQNYFTLN
jgi:hypothetical protein